MPLITDYSTLQSNVSDWLNRTDLTASVPSLIQAAESELRRDFRVRDLVLNSAFVVNADDLALPTGIDHPESWYFDGGTHFGEIEIVPAERLSVLKTRYGTSGVPRFAALIPTASAGLYRARFAPVPDGSYTTVLTYKPLLVALSVAAPTNWLLLGHPDIYLYAALVESAPYLKDDARLVVWRSELERRLESLHLFSERRQFTGTQRKRPRMVIGG